jgi:opacity protein-like surface antigen
MIRRLALLAILLASPAMAQDAPAPPDPEQVIAQCNVAIGTAQVNQGQAELQVVTLKKQLADAQKQLVSVQGRLSGLQETQKAALDKAAKKPPVEKPLH